MPILIFIFLGSPSSASKSDEFTEIKRFDAEILPAADKAIDAAFAPAPALALAPARQQSIILNSDSEVLGLKIDAISINIPLGKTTLDSKKSLIVPANPKKAAWYAWGPKPGNAGTALITGHLDDAGGVAGIFYNLKKLSPGDTVQVKRDDGKVATFKVDKLESYPQDSTFPWGEVYRTVGTSELRLITCDGIFNRKTQRYSRNLVVYASLESLL